MRTRCQITYVGVGVLLVVVSLTRLSMLSKPTMPRHWLASWQPSGPGQPRRQLQAPLSAATKAAIRRGDISCLTAGTCTTQQLQQETQKFSDEQYSKSQKQLKNAKTPPPTPAPAASGCPRIVTGDDMSELLSTSLAIRTWIVLISAWAIATVSCVCCGCFAGEWEALGSANVHAPRAGADCRDIAAFRITAAVPRDKESLLDLALVRTGSQSKRVRPFETLKVDWHNIGLFCCIRWWATLSVKVPGCVHPRRTRGSQGGICCFCLLMTVIAVLPVSVLLNTTFSDPFGVIGAHFGWFVQGYSVLADTDKLVGNLMANQQAQLSRQHSDQNQMLKLSASGTDADLREMLAQNKASVTNIGQSQSKYYDDMAQALHVTLPDGCVLAWAQSYWQSFRSPDQLAKSGVRRYTFQRWDEEGS